MSKTKKRFIAIVLILLVVSMIILGYSYSKYKEETTLESTTGIAKWSFDGGFIEGDSKDTLTSISLADTINSSTIKNGKIAPGTSGDFKIVIDATGSDVDIDYDVSVKAESLQKPTNLYFVYEGNKYSTLRDLIDNLVNTNDESVGDTATKEFSGTLIHKANSTDVNTKEYSIHWEWPYELKDSFGYDETNNTQSEEEYDEQDLQDGQNISNYTFTLDIVGTQAK